jgi:hypothetical protein
LRDPKELAKLSTDIPQITLRDQKELTMKVTSKNLCRCVWLVTSVDKKMLGKITSPEQSNKGK